MGHKLAVGVSGSSTLLQAILDDGVPVSWVFADRPCKGSQVASTAGVPFELLQRTSFDDNFDQDGYARRLAAELNIRGVTIVSLAGFGTILSDAFFESFKGTVINDHPSLLPAFKGWHAVQDALDYGVKITGCTIHFVTNGDVDAGEIIAQEALTILPDETAKDLQNRIKQIEYRLLPQVLRRLMSLPPR